MNATTEKTAACALGHTWNAKVVSHWFNGRRREGRRPAKCHEYIVHPTNCEACGHQWCRLTDRASTEVEFMGKVEVFAVEEMEEQ